MKQLYMFFLLLCSLGLVGHAAAQSATAQGKLHLYPEVAKTYTNIYVDWNELQPFTVFVYNDKDSIVTYWSASPSSSYQKALFVSKMGNGRYYIKVKSDKAEMKQSFTVAH